jgi:hypothetical protein
LASRLGNFATKLAQIIWQDIDWRLALRCDKITVVHEVLKVPRQIYRAARKPKRLDFALRVPPGCR